MGYHAVKNSPDGKIKPPEVFSQGTMCRETPPNFHGRKGGPKKNPPAKKTPLGAP